MPQEILTPGVGEILQVLIDATKDRRRIVAVCPHYLQIGDFGPKGYIVVLDPPPPRPRFMNDDED